MKVDETKPRSPDAGESEETISLPLYVCGLAVSVLGILAVNSDLNDPQFGSTTIVLTILGFIFSVGCRWLGVKPRLAEMFILGICLVFGFLFLNHSLSVELFIPPDVTQGDLVMAVVLEWLTVVRAWLLISDESVVFTAVTSIAMIGLVGSANLNSDFIVYFFAYTVFATFMLLHQTYLTQRSWCTLQTPGNSDSNIVVQQASVAVFSAIAALLVAAAMVVPLRAIGHHLSLAGALKSFVGGQHDNESSSSDGSSPVSLGDDSTFHVGQGDGFSASDQVVMHVQPTDHNEHYYVGRTYDVYEGSDWISSQQNDLVILEPVGNPQNDAGVSSMVLYNLPQPGQNGADDSEIDLSKNMLVEPFSARFVLAGSVTSTLYIPYGTVSMTLPNLGGVSVGESPDNCISIDPAVNTGYSYIANVIDTTTDPTILQTAPPADSACPANIRLLYIDQRGQDIVTPYDQQRLNSTAQQIINSLPLNRRSDYDKAEAIREWVSRRCEYSLSVGPVPSGKDAVSYFLFESREGYCDLFASSMAILCRYAGLPARVATGFDPGIGNDRRGFDLRARDKHAWVQVWFKGFGWQLFDPTEGSTEASAASDFHFNSAWLAWLIAKIRMFVEINGSMPVILTLTTLAGLLYVAKIEYYDKRQLRLAGLQGSNYRSLDAAKQVSTTAAVQYSRYSALNRYGRFEFLLAKAGLVRPKWRTPAEFQGQIAEQLSETDPTILPAVSEIVVAAKRLTDDVMLASYAPADLVGEELLSLEEDNRGSTSLQLIEKQIPSLKRAMNYSRRKQRGIKMSEWPEAEQAPRN